MNVAAVLRRRAARHPAHVALRAGNREVTYRELDAAAARVAELLREDGLRPGERVLLLLPNVPEFAAAYYGVLRAGGVAVPLDPYLTRTEIAAIRRDAGGGRLLVWRDLQRSAPAGGSLTVFVLAPGSCFDVATVDGEAEPPASVDAGDAAVILYTSGTTGHAKGAVLSHGNLAGNAAATARRLGYGEGDVVLAALPLCHAFGQTCGLNAAISSGACLLMAPGLDPQVLLELLGATDVAFMLGTPTIYAGLLAADEDDLLDRVAPRAALSGGAPLVGELHAAWERATGVPLGEGYGLTEASPVVCLDAVDETRRPGSIGRPLDGVQVRVVDELGEDVAAGETGELLVRGPNVMRGYWRRPAETAAVLSQEGWLRTGDLACCGEDGRYEIVGRAKELIISEGYNVHPREVEEALAAHPGVREAAAFGVPHPLLGEEVVACIVVHMGIELDAEQLRRHVARRLAPYKCPRRLWFVDSLPRTATGKVIKHRIVVPDSAAPHIDHPIWL
ncbi:MAG: long-chain acyl-CoA synthetase [Solirubrobacteraceae bacterium]|nr:long-chain acyl-CoA synthetase [Solirubrobacteraceae bacterium]